MDFWRSAAGMVQLAKGNGKTKKKSVDKYTIGGYTKIGNR